MSKRRMLDLFCKAGGSAVGYHRAGFEVVGIDREPQPHYPYTFLQEDALEAIGRIGCDFDCIHASPPCQAYSRATAWRGRRADHPDLIGVVRELLLQTSKPFVIENVQEARNLLNQPIMLCGTMFGLPIRRHRYFEIPSFAWFLTPDCQHRASDYSHDHGSKQSESVYRDAMDCQWMTVHESRQAIPPAYTEFLGRQLLLALRNSN